MAIKEKAAPGPFDGWPGADGWTGAWAAVLEANRVALDRWTKVSDTMVKGMFVISQEMTQFAHTSATATARARRSVATNASPKRQRRSILRKPIS